MDLPYFRTVVNKAIRLEIDAEDNKFIREKKREPSGSHLGGPKKSRSGARACSRSLRPR